MLRSTSGLPFVEDGVASGAGFDWGVAAPPRTGLEPVVNFYGASVSVCRTTPERQLAAWLFLKWFTEPPQQARWVKASNYFPARRSTRTLLAGYLEENPRLRQRLPAARVRPGGTVPARVRGGPPADQPYRREGRAGRRRGDLSAPPAAGSRSDTGGLLNDGGHEGENRVRQHGRDRGSGRPLLGRADPAVAAELPDRRRPLFPRDDPGPRGGQEGVGRGERGAGRARARDRRPDHRGGCRSGRRGPRRPLPARGLADGLGHPVEHERQRGDLEPRHRDGGGRDGVQGSRASRTITSTAASRRTTSSPRRCTWRRPTPSRTSSSGPCNSWPPQSRRSRPPSTT